MLDKLASLEIKYNELTEQVSDPQIIAQQDEWQKLCKARAELEPIVEAYLQYKACIQGIADAKEMIADKSDPEMAEMAKMELYTILCFRISLSYRKIYQK